MRRVLGNRVTSAGKLSANSDDTSRVGEDALGGHAGAEHRALSRPAPSSGDFDVQGSVQAEVFVVWLDGARIRLTGPRGPGAWYIEIGAGDDPLSTVVRLVRTNFGEPMIVHSTSWRRDRGAVILSFVVVVPPSGVGKLVSVDVGRSEIARGGADTAPEAISSEQVVEHALRHLSWLVRDDPAVLRKLAGGWADALRAYVPEPFQNLRAAR